MLPAALPLDREALLPVVLAIESGIFHALAALGANGRTVVTAEMVWLCVAVVLTISLVGRFERDGSDDRGE